ncbi:MAG: sugar O-acetyltransferase, partial [Muribaculaceae bacterium]|nr:sugar O-acetyltransferase [Muribaculaceae bacterium]
MKHQKVEISAEAQREIEKMMSGELYDATRNDALLDILNEVQNMCYDYNQLRPTQAKERTELMRTILGRTGKRFKIISPFICDYGFNIEIGENFFSNSNMVILDEAKVTFGDNVFIGPNCSFYTAGHPLDVERRNAGLEYSWPIKVGNNVWFGGGVTVVPGVTIGDDVVIGAGSVVTHDIPSGVLAAGNP